MVIITIQSNPGLSIILNQLTPTDKICFHEHLLPKPELVFTHAGGENHRVQNMLLTVNFIIFDTN